MTAFPIFCQTNPRKKPQELKLIVSTRYENIGENTKDKDWLNQPSAYVFAEHFRKRKQGNRCQSKKDFITCEEADPIQLENGVKWIDRQAVKFAIVDNCF